MVRRIIGLCVLAMAAAAATPARAGCEKDTDCKGDRICSGGACVFPSTAPAADPGWAKGAGITGLVLAPIALGLFIGSAVTDPYGDPDGSPLPAAPLAGTAGLVHIVGGAIAGGGAASANGVKHNLGCLISGWTFYGVTIVYTALEFGIGFGLKGGPPHPALIGVGGLLSATGVVLLSTDALVVAKRARAAKAAAALEPPRRVALYPLLSPVTSGSHTVGFAGGVGMSF